MKMLKIKKLLFDPTGFISEYDLKSGSDLKRLLEEKYLELGLEVEPGPNLPQKLFHSKLTRLDLVTYARLLKIFKLRLPKQEDCLFKWVDDPKAENGKRLVFTLGQRMKRLDVENGEQLARLLTEKTGKAHFGATMRSALSEDYARVDFGSLSTFYALCEIKVPPPLFRFEDQPPAAKFHYERPPAGRPKTIKPEGEAVKEAKPKAEKPKVEKVKAEKPKVEKSKAEKPKTEKVKEAKLKPIKPEPKSDAKAKLIKTVKPAAVAA